MADELRKLTERNAPFADPVIASTGLAVFEGEPEQMGCIEPMHRAPPIGSVTDISRDPLLTRGFHQEGGKALLVFVMHRRRQSNDLGSDATRRQRKCHLFGLAPQTTHGIRGTDKLAGVLGSS
jgi:hypothetical protein